MVALTLLDGETHGCVEVHGHRGAVKPRSTNLVGPHQRAACRARQLRFWVGVRNSERSKMGHESINHAYIFDL